MIIRRKRFEYKITDNGSLSALQEFGQEGWELCSVVKGHMGSTVLTWKREILPCIHGKFEPHESENRFGFKFECDGMFRGEEEG